MYALIRDGYGRDLLVAAVVGILIGSLIVMTTSTIADRFLGSTVRGLLGEYGEWDLVVHVRTESKHEALSAVRAMLDESFPGATYRESITLLSRSNIFISLDTPKTRRAMVDLIAASSRIPGYAGHTVMIEPRVTVGGLSARVAPVLRREFEAHPDVKFTFIDGTDLHIVCRSEATVGRVQKALSDVLEVYSILDIRVMSGLEEEYRTEMERILAGRLRRMGEAWDVTPRAGGEDRDRMVATLSEIRSFLWSWMSEVSIVIEPGSIAKDDVIALIPAGSVVPPKGRSITRDDVVAVITDVDGNAAAAMIVSGSYEDMISESRDPAAVIAFDAYAVVSDALGQRIGAGTVFSRKQNLLTAIHQARVVITGFEAAVDQANSVSASWEDAIAAYEGALSALSGLKASLEGLAGMEQGRLHLEPKVLARVSALAEETAGRLQRIQSLVSTLSLLNGSYGPLIENLELWRIRVDSFNFKLRAINTAIAEGGETLGLLADLEAASQGFLSTFTEMDLDGLKAEIASLREGIEHMAQADTQAIVASLDDLEASLPSFRDEDASGSIQIMDRMIGGQMDPRDRLVYLVRAKGPGPSMVSHALAVQGVESAYSVPAGAVQPGVRGEITRLLGSVRMVLGAGAALVFTLLSLVFDHSQVVSAASAIRGFAGPKRPGLAEYAYAGAAGALTLGVVSMPAYGFGLANLAMGAAGLTMGLLMARVSDRLARTDMDELEACLSFGMNYGQIMRDIIIPGGKPGALLLTRRLVGAGLNMRRQPAEGREALC